MLFVLLLCLYIPKCIGSVTPAGYFVYSYRKYSGIYYVAGTVLNASDTTVVKEVLPSI